MVDCVFGACGHCGGFLALREHYRTEGQSPCSINEKWDCGTVNKSRFASIGGVFDQLANRSAALSDDAKPRFEAIRKIPVADVGIAGYILLGLLALMKRWRLLAAAAVLAWLFRSTWRTLRKMFWKSGAFTA